MSTKKILKKAESIKIIKSKKDKINNILEESKKIRDSFSEEIIEVRKKYKEEPNKQYWRRIYIRTVFAFIESECFRLKQNTLNRINESLLGSQFSPGEISLLKEKTFNLNNKGEIEEKDIYLKTEKNLRFAFNSAAKLSFDFKLNVSGVGWESFKKALKIRHQVTHSKKFSDLIISDKEMNIAKKAFNWFINSLNMLFDAQAKYSKELAKKLNQLKKEIEEL